MNVRLYSRDLATADMFCYKTHSRTAGFGPCATVFRSSSMAEHSAVNRRVVGSSPTCGANIMVWVYILENPRGKLYVGYTEDLAARLLHHNRTDSFDGHFTRKNGPWKLVWQESHDTRGSAMRREKQIKAMKSAKWIRTELLA